jgi:2,4-dienoyl-CoA reductase (NADPH2)
VRQTLPRFKPPREMTKEDIKRCIRDHADAARRAIEAGYDGVELCGIMGYLITNFNSRFTNRRSDEYGGSIENRGRFMREVIAAIRDTIGDEHVLSIRLNGAELMDEVGGNTPEECLEFIKMAAQSGADCVSIAVGWQESRVSSIARDVPDGYWLYLAEQAKKSVNVPIAFGARLGDPALADKAIAEGKIDFWEVCRPFLADPELLHKVAEDRLEDIKPCIGCLFCLSRFFNDVPYGCTVNPILGQELVWHIQPAARRKRIMVVGAGPAGLECALTAARRGHEVTVYEKSDRLGGQLIAMSQEVSGQELFELLDYYQVQLKKLGVEVKLNTEVTPALVRAVRLDVDAIVLATGSSINAQRYGNQNSVVTAHDVLEGKVTVGRRVIVCGGGKVGLVTAEYLARMGKEVCIVEQGRRIAEDVISTWRWRHMAWVEQFKVKTLVNTRVKEVVDGGLVVVDAGGKESFVPADTIVAAAPRKPRQELAEALEFLCDELYVIGDAAAPRWIHNAIRDGFRLGVSI